MSSAGIDISITGNASPFLASLREAERAARQVSEAAAAGAQREEEAYKRAAAEARARAQTREAAARAVRQAEQEAAAATQRAARAGTAAAQEEARAKAALAAAARHAAAEAARAARAAADAANAQAEAMRRASRASVDAAEAHRLATEAAARAAAAARNQPPGGGGGGGGNPPPDGGGRGGRGGSGGGGGRGGRGGGGGLGNTSGAMDANMAYQIVQDTWQGGFAGVANQIPQLIGLLVKYGTKLGAAGAVIGTGAAIGYAVTDPQGFGEMLRKAGGYVTKFAESLANPTKVLEGWVKGISGASAMEESARKMEDRLKAFNYQRELERAKQRGAATGDNAENLANAARIGAEGRASALDRNLTAREQANELERIRIEGILNEQEQRKAMAEFERKAAMEQALIRKKAAEEEFAIREREHRAAKQTLDELYAQELEAKRGPVTAEKNAKLEELKAARDGVQSRADSAKAALQEAGKGVADAAAGEQTAAFQAEAQKRRMANEDAARFAEQARNAGLWVRQFWREIEDATRKGIKSAKEAAAKQAASKQEMDQDLEELQLRARGSTRQADKMRKEREIQGIAERYKGSNPKISNEQARAYAEQMYDVTHDKGRIRGAGYKTGTQPTPAFGIDNPGFTPGKLGVPASSPTNFTGLDALDEMQKKNRRIRGAGHKEAGGSSTDGQQQERPAGTTSPAAALGTAILGQLSSMNRKLDNLAPGKQTRTR